VIIAVLVVVAAAWLVFSGKIGVSAADARSGFLDTVLAQAQERSVKAHASRLPEPDLAGASVPLGAYHYRGKCVICHGAPGLPRSEIGEGLHPAPPELSHAMQEWSPREILWIVTNGIRMTGMPAFGPTHDEEELRAIAAFVLRLPGMSPQEFQALAEAGGGPASHHH
jgi:mono/diheme cytochrome c family protein